MARARTKTLSQRLDTPVEIQAEPNPDNAALQTATGEVDLATEANWTVVATNVFAEIEPDAGGEVIIGGQGIGSQRWRVTVRRRNDLEPGHRLRVLSGKLSGKFLYVESEARPERAEEQVVICRQGRKAP